MNPAADAHPPDSQTSLLHEPRGLSRDVMLISGFCLLLAAVLRLVRVSYRELFGAEFWTLSFVSGKRGDLLDSLFHGHLPLYYEFMRGWAKVAGTGEVALRAPSVVFGLLTCAAFVFFAQRYLRRTAFAICVIAFALNPILVASSNHAAPFALMGLFAVLSNYFCIRGLDEGGRRNWALWAVYSVLGALTHPFFWFLLLGQFAFAVMRPRRTPRQFYALGVAALVGAAVATVSAAVYAGHRYPKHVDVATPSLDDMVRALVAVLLGDVARFGYNDKTFVQAVLYLFVLATLVLSVFYYRRRAEEASAMPDNVVFIDMTQDVVGNWYRLNLAGFLLFQWITFIVPAVGIWMVGTYASNMRLEPEYFLVCLPSLVILVAAGIDAARPTSAASIGAGWRRWFAVGLGVVYVVIMAVYCALALTDSGSGLKKAAARIAEEGFDPSRDAFMIVHSAGIERGIEQYLAGLPAVKLDGTEPVAETRRIVAEAATGRERVFVFYRNDYRRFGRSLRPLVREWFDEQMRAGEINTKVNKWEMSRPERTELRIYSRLAPGENPDPAEVPPPAPPPPPRDADEATTAPGVPPPAPPAS